ncbi:hypothetical protein B0H13DRAFT_1891975 [Mycena leptocephala]|nr:hypothetical protein B0H13DRAFT_1891975 [Mycena leptocephala]
MAGFPGHPGQEIGPGQAASAIQRDIGVVDARNVIDRPRAFFCVWARAGGYPLRNASIRSGSVHGGLSAFGVVRALWEYKWDGKSLKSTPECGRMSKKGEGPAGRWWRMSGKTKYKLTRLSDAEGRRTGKTKVVDGRTETAAWWTRAAFLASWFADESALVKSPVADFLRTSASWIAGPPTLEAADGGCATIAGVSRVQNSGRFCQK